MYADVVERIIEVNSLGGKTMQKVGGLINVRWGKELLVAEVKKVLKFPQQTMLEVLAENNLTLVVAAQQEPGWGLDYE